MARGAGIVSRLTAAFTLTGALLYVALGAWTLAREADDLDRATQSELTLLGRALQVSIENALRDRQIGDITETLARLDQIAPEVDLYVFTPSGTLSARSAGAPEVPPAIGGALADALGAQQRALLEVDGEPPAALALATPLRDDDGTPLGALVVVRPLDDLRADLARTRRSLVLGLAGFLVCALLVGHLLGEAIVGWPLRQLIAAIDAVRSGQSDARLAITARHELGEVSTRFNAMLDELAHARHVLIESAESRRQQFEALKHADKLASVGQLSASLAHEIGSPLQTLISAAEWLAEQPGDPQRTARQAKVIAEQGNRIARIVAQLLDVARRQRPSAPAPAHATIDGVLDLLDIAARKRQVALTRAIQLPKSARIEQPEIVQQVLLNLVQNALQALEGPGTVAIDVHEGPWTDRAGQARVALWLVVDDSGPGVDAARSEQIFEPFFTTRADAGGSGLGLSIVRGLCQSVDGEVRASVSPLGGARFTATLPLREVRP